MSDNQYGVILVYSTSHAMRAEKLLRRAGIGCKLITVPRHLSSDCGVCVRVKQDQLEAATLLAQKAGVGIQSIHQI